MNDLKSKIKHTAQKAKDKFDETVTWCFEHPVETAAIAGFSLKVLGKVHNIAALNREEKRRSLEFYDARVGKYAKIRRPLTRDEQVEVNRRYANHESYTDIFWDMHLLR